MGLVRVAIHRWRWSLLVAAPVVYLGLQLLQDRFLTGFMMTGLGHSQYRWTTFVQMADLAGVNGVSALMVFVGACVARMLPIAGRAANALAGAAAGRGPCALVLGYGTFRQAQDRPGAGAHRGPDPRLDRHHDEDGSRAAGLDHRAVRPADSQAPWQENQLDLIVWPETMFRYPWFTFRRGFRVAAGRGLDGGSGSGLRAEKIELLDRLVRRADPAGHRHDPLSHPKRNQHYNSALLVDQGAPSPSSGTTRCIA